MLIQLLHDLLVVILLLKMRLEQLNDYLDHKDIIVLLELQFQILEAQELTILMHQRVQVQIDYHDLLE